MDELEYINPCICVPDTCKRPVPGISLPERYHEWLIDNQTEMIHSPEKSKESTPEPPESPFDLQKLIGGDSKSLKEYQNKLAFREVLVISMYHRDSYKFSLTTPLTVSNAELKTVGGMVIDVQLAGPNKKNFLVFVSTQLEHKKRNGGSHITSWLLPNLQTIEERRIEFLSLDEANKCVDKRQLYVGMQGDFYYVMNRSRIHSTGCSQMYPCNLVRNLITESSNFILMRYLAMIRYIGSFETCTLYLDGDLCRNIYYSDGPEAALINNSRCDIIRVQRIIKEKCGIVHSCITTLLLNGHIVRQEWEHCAYVLHLNPLVEVSNSADHSKLNRAPVYTDWEKDMQLMSK